jgi:dihydroflavonol-4-reductase
MNQKAFVTGVTGFVGANLARLLLERGYEVRALVRKNADRGNLPEDPRFTAVEGDLRDANSIVNAMKGCKLVFHVAADYRFWAKNPQELYDSNVVGTANLMKAASDLGVSRIVHTSTVGAMGLANQPEPCDEKTPEDPGQFTSHYKRSKLEAEQVALDFGKQGLPVVIVNPSTPIGAWDRKPTPTGKIIVDFVNGKIPAYVETGLNFANVRDICEGHLLAAEKGRIGERYILGGENITMVRFLDLIAKECEALGMIGAPNRAPSIRIPYRMAWLTGLVSTTWSDLVTHREPAVALEAVKMSKRYMYFDSSKAIRELGLPQTPIAGAIRNALLWFHAQGYFKRIQYQNTERTSYVSTH